MNLAHTLSEMTADLVEFEENELFLERLFQLQPGTWSDLDCLCDNLDGYQVTLQRLKKSLQERVRVTWLDYSDSRYGDGYSLILFFAEGEQWHNVALYNKRRLERAIGLGNGAIMQIA